MSISPDGKTMYLPSLVVDVSNVAREDGEIITTIQVYPEHTTPLRPLGQASLHGRYRFAMAVADTSWHAVALKQGFGRHSPLTTNSQETQCCYGQ